MIFIQATPPPITWRTYLQDANTIAQILGTVMVVLYVIYTYKMFKQIKKQTDYQQDAYLRVDTNILKEIPSPKLFGNSFQLISGQLIPANEQYSLKYIQKDLHTKLKGILQPIFDLEDALFDGNYYALFLTNYGNAEVIRIDIKIDIEIKNTKELIDRKMLKEEENHKITLSINEIIGRNGGQIRIPIISTASFPIYSISLNGTYIDVRNKSYTIPTIITRGENKHFHTLAK